MAEGAYDLPYAMPNRLVEHVLAHEPVPVGFWRSVGHSYNAFFVEGFLDEVAPARPARIRSSSAAPCSAARRATARARSRRRRRRGWGRRSLPRPGRARARHRARGILPLHRRAGRRGGGGGQRGAVRVRRVVCAIDCGKAVNPDIVVAQMESGIVFGLTAALYGEITLKGGRVEQAQLSADYEMLRMASCPAIEVADRRERLGAPRRRRRARHAADRARGGERGVRVRPASGCASCR